MIVVHFLSAGEPTVPVQRVNAAGRTFLGAKPDPTQAKTNCGLLVSESVHWRRPHLGAAVGDGYRMCQKCTGAL